MTGRWIRRLTITVMVSATLVLTLAVAILVLLLDKNQDTILGQTEANGRLAQEVKALVERAEAQDAQRAAIVDQAVRDIIDGINPVVRPHHHHADGSAHAGTATDRQKAATPAVRSATAPSRPTPTTTVPPPPKAPQTPPPKPPKPTTPEPPPCQSGVRLLGACLLG